MRMESSIQKISNATTVFYFLKAVETDPANKNAQGKLAALSQN